AVGRCHPDVAIEIGIDRSGGAGGRARRDILGQLVIARVDAAERAVTARDGRADVGPYHAVLITGDALGAGRDGPLVVDLEMFHRSGAAIDLGDGGLEAGLRIRDPEIAVEVHLRVVNAVDVVHLGRGPERPITAVVRPVVTAFHRKVVFLD